MENTKITYGEMHEETIDVSQPIEAKKVATKKIRFDIIIIIIIVIIFSGAFIYAFNNKVTDNRSNIEKIRQEIINTNSGQLNIVNTEIHNLKKQLEIQETMKNEIKNCLSANSNTGVIVDCKTTDPELKSLISEINNI